MYSAVVFICGFAQLVFIAASYALGAQVAFSIAVLYGSPPYLILNLFNEESAFTGNTLLFVALIIYHVLKYLCIFLAQRSGYVGRYFYAGIAMEVCYLAITSYYMI